MQLICILAAVVAEPFGNATDAFVKIFVRRVELSMMLAVAGVDVGGDKKQCNLVILRGTSILHSAAKIAPGDLLSMCVEHDVVAVGIDAPCQWRAGDGPRKAERELAGERISSFSAPARERAIVNTTGFYDWMFNGERVYQALARTYPLLKKPGYSDGRVSFETYPHAITCAMLGKDVASAKQKRVQRKQLLDERGIDSSKLTSIDARDAALCALTARYLLEGMSYAIGDAAGGYIQVPAKSSGASPFAL
jgi:predicted nuclease with RNAse H fold